MKQGRCAHVEKSCTGHAIKKRGGGRKLTPADAFTFVAAEPIQTAATFFHFNLTFAIFCGIISIHVTYSPTRRTSWLTSPVPDSFWYRAMTCLFRQTTNVI